MDFDFSEEQTMIRASVRDFAQICPPNTGAGALTMYPTALCSRNWALLIWEWQ
jgi:hypothetical protein